MIVTGKSAGKTIGLVQAHYLGCGDGTDLSLATVTDKLAVAEVIERLKSMPQVCEVVVAVPDDPGNVMFAKIAADLGARCYFGDRTNALARCASAAAGADTVIHVMGQHCFIDTALLAEMLTFLEETGAHFVSAPEAFTPYFAGKVYRRALLDDVAAVIAALPEGRDRHCASFTSFIESDPWRFGALVYEKLPEYDRDFLLKVGEAAREIFEGEDMPVAACGTLFESYEFAQRQFGGGDDVLDIACGDGHGCRILAERVNRVLGVDINQPQIVSNQQRNGASNISYDVDDCFALSLPDGAVTGATAMKLIEYLPAERVDQFISEVRRVVAPGGRFICSTPQSSHGALVPWHVKEYSVAELRALLERHFSSVEILSSQSDGRLSEDPGQKMVALCR